MLLVVNNLELKKDKFLIWFLYIDLGWLVLFVDCVICIFLIFVRNLYVFMIDFVEDFIL